MNTDRLDLQLLAPNSLIAHPKPPRSPHLIRSRERRSERVLRLFNYRELVVSEIEWNMNGDLLLDADDWQSHITLQPSERPGKSNMSTE